MSVKVLVPIANGTEDVESTTIIDLLRRADIDVTVAGTHSQVKFARGLNVIPDKLINDINDDEIFDAIIIPGGLPGVTYLTEHKRLTEIIKRHKELRKNIGAICAAPTLLDKHQLLDQESVITSFPSLKADLSKYNYSEADVVISNNVITSKGLGTAIDFSLKLIEILLDKETSDRIAEEIVYK